MKEFLFDIHAFDGEGGGAAAAGASAGSGEGANTNTNGAIQNAAGTQVQPLVTRDTTGDNTDPNQGMSFDDYVKAHKDEASKWFQKQFNRRHADYNQLKSKADSAAKVMDVLAAKYGLESGDYEGITKAIGGDDSMYEDAAIEAGMTVEQYKRFSEAQAENRRLRDAQKQFEQQQQIQRQMDEWDRQSNNLKQVFPDFNLDAELENPDFERALRSGLSIDRAFYAVHGADIASGAMQYTAQAVRQATAQDLAARRNRPAENGLSTQASAKVTKDVHSLTRKERAELAKRSMNGERIRF